MKAVQTYPERVNTIAGAIEGAAAEAEKSRRLPAPLLSALHEAGLFRLLLPAVYGGAEVDLLTFFRTIEAVAKRDASTAWCLCQANGCAMSAAYLAPAVAQKIWGNDPTAVLAWGPGAKSRAVIIDGGYRVTGNWMFASGSRHANWLGGHVTVRNGDGSPVLADDGSVVISTMLFPAAEAAMTDVWDVIGLRGTGSDSFSVEDLFVAKDYAVSRDDPAARRCDTALYQFPAMSLYAAGFSGTALGIARSMLESFVDLAGKKTPRLARNPLKDDGVIQTEVALADARLCAARAFLIDELGGIWQAVTESGALTIDQRIRIRLAATYGIHQAREVADMIYELAGATAIFTSNPFERRFRDINTVTQQLQGRRSHFRTVGAYQLGHPADMTVI
jgi:alkylation response protein AidB-like acyl-CoA dehydrogenase